jgi:co-chaperonin GroES (HSP10)
VALIVPRKTIEQFSKCETPSALRQEIFSKLGVTLHELEIMFNRVLVAIYIRPERTAGGIIRVDETKEEDVWQGKVGMIVKMGDLAYKDSDDFSFQGQRAAVGEWVVFRIGDTWDLLVNDVPCRLIADDHIKMKIQDPRSVF